MNFYKICMIGLGSIGKRHLVNISSHLSNNKIHFQIDIFKSSNSEIDEDLKNMITNIYYSYKEVPLDYDVVFITNPTHLHYETVKKFISNTKHIFIEKPVFHDVLDIKELDLKEGSQYYVACPVRYTDVIQYLKNEIDLSEVFSARIVCSSYLPEWRKNVDYRTTYSAHKSQGGGVSIDLIHELDYMKYLFGEPLEMQNFRGKFSNLEIDSDDLSIYMAKYNDKLVEIHLDYFGKRRIREIQLFCKNETIVGDIENAEVRFLSQNKVIKFELDRNKFYEKEIKYFFDVIEGNNINTNDIDSALKTLKYAIEGEN